eukprot:437365-Amphidinium_carterae.1
MRWILPRRIIATTGFYYDIKTQCNSSSALLIVSLAHFLVEAAYCSAMSSLHVAQAEKDTSNRQDFRQNAAKCGRTVPVHSNRNLEHIGVFRYIYAVLRASLLRFAAQQLNISCFPSSWKFMEPIGICCLGR